MNKYRAHQYFQRFKPKETVADLYDDEMFVMALSALMPGYEYPDVSHLTVGQILAKFYSDDLKNG